MSLRGITRTFGVYDQTILRWAGEKKIQALPAWKDTLLPGQAGDVLKRDELWSFVQKKTQEVWLWIVPSVGGPVRSSLTR